MNEKQFILLIEEHKDEFYAYIYRQLWDKSQLDDVFSQAMLTVWEKRDLYREDSNFRAWVYKIITYKCFNMNKKEHRNVIHFEDLGEHFDPVDERNHFLHELNDHWIQSCEDEIPKALARLSEKERSCLLLRSMEELSYKEIADATELPLGTVMTHLHRARKKMQKLLFDYGQNLGWTSKNETSERPQKKENS